KLPAGKPLLDVLKEVQDSQSRLSAHQHLGLSEIQQLAGLGELFDTLVVFENYPVEHSGLSGSAAGVRLCHVGGHDATHYPLSLMVAPGERLQLRLDYRADLFDRASVEALGWRLVRLLEGAVAGPDVAIGRLELLSAAERRQLLEEWNATDRVLGGDACGCAGGAGCGASGCGCGGIRGCAAELRRAGGSRQPVGASSARAWGWCGDGGWTLPGAFAGDAGGAHRHPQGGGWVSAARPELPGGALGVHAGGFQCGACDHHGGAGGSAGPPRRAAAGA